MHQVVVVVVEVGVVVVKGWVVQVGVSVVVDVVCVQGWQAVAQWALLWGACQGVQQMVVGCGQQRK